MEKTESICPRTGTAETGRFKNASLAKCKIRSYDNDKIIGWLKKGRGFLIYQGVPGCGKTYLSHAVRNDANKFGEFRYIRLWEERHLFQRIRQGIAEGRDHNAEAESLIDDDLIIYDDLGSSGTTEWRIEVLFGIIDFRYASQKPTMITTNLTEYDIKDKLGPRIHSRLFAKENTFLEFGQIDLRQLHE